MDVELAFPPDDLSGTVVDVNLLFATLESGDGAHGRFYYSEGSADESVTKNGVDDLSARHLRRSHGVDGSPVQEGVDGGEIEKIQVPWLGPRMNGNGVGLGFEGAPTLHTECDEEAIDPPVNGSGHDAVELSRG
jgi:hypothetical protein